MMPRVLIPQSPILNRHTWVPSPPRTAWDSAKAPLSPRGFLLKFRSERTFMDEKRSRMSLEEAGVISQLRRFR
jgi:hypothetical protein